jgi:hypothetical protein
MSQYVGTETPGLYRDTSTGALINRNDAEYNQFKLERARVLQQESINKKVEDLSSSVAEIKEILKMLVKNNGN